MIVARAAVKSDPGRKRRHNEDSFVCEPPLFAVADGMGGAQAGEVASQLAAAALREANGPVPDRTGEARVIELIEAANRRVHERASTDAATSGMGTTITVAVVGDGGSVVFGHVGDSRAYLLRDGQLEQLTNDHSLVAELVRRGELSPAEAEVHPQRSVITRALGTEPDIDVDTFSVEARPGDLFLICSDGLSDMLARETMSSIVGAHRDDLDAAAKELVREANRAGGEDNITALLFEVAAGEDVGGDTTPMAAVAAPEPEEPVHDEDEDTLEGIRSPAAESEPGPEPPAPEPPDPPPAVDTMVVPPEEAVELAAPARPSLARRLLVLLVIVTLVLVIAALVLWGLAR